MKLTINFFIAFSSDFINVTIFVVVAHKFYFRTITYNFIVIFIFIKVLSLFFCVIFIRNVLYALLHLFLDLNLFVGFFLAFRGTTHNSVVIILWQLYTVCW